MDTKFLSKLFGMIFIILILGGVILSLVISIRSYSETEEINRMIEEQSSVQETE